MSQPKLPCAMVQQFLGALWSAGAVPGTHNCVQWEVAKLDTERRTSAPVQAWSSVFEQLAWRMSALCFAAAQAEWTVLLPDSFETVAPCHGCTWVAAPDRRDSTCSTVRCSNVSDAAVEGFYSYSDPPQQGGDTIRGGIRLVRSGFCRPAEIWD